MNADIALAKCTEDRIGDRMSKRVGVRMPLGPTIGSNVHTTKHKLASFHEPVSVSANSDPHHIIV
jgi:hypothetical protein